MNISTLSIIQGIFLLTLIPILWLSLRKAQRGKRAQDQIVEALGREGLNDWCRVYVARAPFFSRRFKLIGFEARGVLVNLPHEVRLIAELPSGERLEKIYPKNNLGLRWLGNTGIASSNLHWIAIGSSENPLMLAADVGFNALQSREATADICRRVNAEFRLPDSAKSDFALEKNPASNVVVSVFILLLVFAFIDGIVLNKYEWLETETMTFEMLLPGMAVLVLCALPVYWWLTKARVPARESLVLSTFIAIALSIAYIPAIKRVDQLLSITGPQSYAYRLGENALLVPVSSGPPKIDYASRKEYWDQFEEDSIQHLDLVHGPLGLWQLDHSELEKKMRQFYEGRRKNKK